MIKLERYDVYSRFARRHLSTPAERAVYLVLVAQESPSWSAAELAERTHEDPGVVDRVLRSFERASVVEAIEGSNGCRYRWRSDVDYLLGSDEGAAGSVDPVCGMPVLSDSPYRTRDAVGRLFTFCSSVCLSAFRAAPGRFTVPAPAGARAAV